MVPSEEKRFSLVFLHGREDQGGWKTLAFNLKSIDVLPMFRPSEVSKVVEFQLEDSRGGVPLKGVSFAKVVSRGMEEVGRLFGFKVG